MQSWCQAHHSSFPFFFFLCIIKSLYKVDCFPLLSLLSSIHCSPAFILSLWKLPLLPDNCNGHFSALTLTPSSAFHTGNPSPVLEMHFFMGSCQALVFWFSSFLQLLFIFILIFSPFLLPFNVNLPRFCLEPAAHLCLPHPNSDSRCYIDPDNFCICFSGPALQELSIAHLHEDIPKAPKTKHVPSGGLHIIIPATQLLSLIYWEPGASQLLCPPVPLFQAIWVWLKLSPP